MNSQLQELADLMVDSFDPNEIAFAFASSYNWLSKEYQAGDPNRGIFKKVATQFSRVNGHFPVLDQVKYQDFYYDNEKQRPWHWSKTHSPYSNRPLHPALVIAYQDPTLQPIT